MFDSLNLRGRKIEPALFLAPMADITHSAFRRLISDFGGYGALFTEMLGGKALLHEDISNSPFTKRRKSEGLVFYQLMLSCDEKIRSIIDRLSAVNPEAIDINLGCPAPLVRKSGAGAALYDRMDILHRVLDAVRSAWQGILTVKCRLGHDHKTWQREFEKRLRIFENYYIDAIHIHPRFFDEKLKRRPRHHLLQWITHNTYIPVIANGDISPEMISRDCRLSASGIQGAMLGRMAVVRPWAFKECDGQIPEIDYAEVWIRFYEYINEDFPPEKAIGRIKGFSAYYARNFFYGHQLFKAVQNARTLSDAYNLAVSFFSTCPQVVAKPSVSGI